MGLLLGSFPSLAHHAFDSEFDPMKVVKIQGVVTMIARMNPHSLIFVDARNDKGVGEYWAVETLPALQLNAYGLGPTGSLKVGDKIEGCGFTTKDGVAAMKSYQAQEPISESLKSIPRPIFSGRLVSPKVLTLPGGKKLGSGTCE